MKVQTLSISDLLSELRGCTIVLFLAIKSGEGITEAKADVKVYEDELLRRLNNAKAKKSVG